MLTLKKTTSEPVLIDVGVRRERDCAYSIKNADSDSISIYEIRIVVLNQVSKRIAARQKHLAKFPGEGTPPDAVACELLCEDHVGTYTLPYLCHWSGGTWRSVGTKEPVKAGLVGWRVAR
jgi:hypothetical protein